MLKNHMDTGTVEECHFAIRAIYTIDDCHFVNRYISDM